MTTGFGSRFTSTEKKKSALINIETKDGITESVMLTTGEDSAIELAPSVWLSLMSIHEHWATDRPTDVCGRATSNQAHDPTGRSGGCTTGVSSYSRRREEEMSDEQNLITIDGKQYNAEDFPGDQKQFVALQTGGHTKSTKPAGFAAR